MSILKFPKKVCNSLNASIAKFWWGQVEEEGKIHWKKWSELAKSKLTGGLGFKEFEEFNCALLAKLSWRIIRCPEAFWVKMLKGIYFPKSEFMAASKTCHPSWVWSSVLAGREVIREAAAWKIGNGVSVNAWEDRWVPGLEGMKLKHQGEAGKGSGKVAEFIDQRSRKWRNEVLNQKLSVDEAAAVSVIRLPREEKADKLIWPAEKSGEYTVKSGYQSHHYKVHAHLNSNQASSSHIINEKVWKTIWNISAAPKVVSFMWKAISNILATMENLCKKRVARSSTCPICSKQRESIEHCLLLCDWARSVWFGGSLSYVIEERSITTLDIWLLEVAEQLGRNREERKRVMTTVAYTCWWIWRARCDMILGRKAVNCVYTIEMVNGQIEEWVQRGNTRNEVEKKPKVKMKWEAPPYGVLKINCDGSLKLPERRGGIGVVVRNWEGKMIEGRAGAEGASEVIIMEAAALLKGMRLAGERGYQNAYFESDSTELIKAIKDATSTPWAIDSEVQEIKAVMGTFPSWKIAMVQRSCNRAADWVARKSRQMQCPENWREEIPAELLMILEEEKPQTGVG